MNKKVTLASVICFLLVFWGQILLGQGIELQNYVVTQWGMEEGLPQSSVNDIIQTRDGYIWMATFGGIVRFDGVSFTTFDRANTEEMRSDRVLTLFEDSQGSIWIGTEDGLLKYNHGNFETYLLTVNGQVYAPNWLIEDGNGKIWISVNGEIFTLKDNQFVKQPVLIDDRVKKAALKDPDGVWIAHAKELLRTTGDTVVQVMDLGNMLPSNIIDFIEYPQGSGTYFFGTDGDGVIRYEDEEFTKYSADAGLASRYIWNFNTDRQGNFWVSAYNGQSFWTGKGFQEFKAVTSKEDIQFTSILEDNEGNYWVGTMEKGVYKLRPSVITTIGFDQGLLNDKMLSLTTLKDGRVLFATNCGGIYEFKGKEVEPLALNQWLPNQCVWSIFEDSKGRVWFGARELYRVNSLDKPGNLIGKEQGFTGNDIYAIYEDSEGNIWIGCFNGLYRFDGKSYHRFSIEDGLAYNDTRTIFEDSKGNLWVGSSSGLSVLRGDEIRKISLLDGVDVSKSNPEPYIRAIHEDENGTMWFGSYGSGIFRLKDGELSNIRAEDGLFDNIVSHLREDEFGNFWMGSNRGIFRAKRADLNDFSDGKVNSVSSISYGVEDGMKSAETNGGFQPSTIFDEEGNIYFPTISGVAVVATKKIEDVTNAPPVYIERLSSSEDQIPLSESITLPYDNAYIEIRYTALNYKDPDKLIFRYKMEGFDNNWINVDNRRIALYSKIPPGNYTFQVNASTNNGVWSEKGASLKITVVPPFWQTTWFYVLIGFLFLISGPLIFYYRFSLLKKDRDRQKRFTEQLIESQEQERRRIASELHDGLGQQILVIKNRVELAKKQVSDPKMLTEQLDEILQSAVVSISDVRSISHGLRPVNLEKFGLTEALSNLCDQVQDASEVNWSYYFDNIDGVIPEEKEINFYRVIQEAINNILKHSSAEEASVMVKQVGNEIKATIWDDGIGFDPKEEVIFGGLGFIGMKERIETLGGTISLESKITEGTTLRIIIPIA